MNQDMQMNMSMTIVWSQQCAFIFQAFKTQKVITFLIGCVFSSIIAALSVGMPALKQKLIPELQDKDHYSVLNGTNQNINQNNVTKIKLLLYYLIYSTIHIANMLLVMTMNGGVLLFMLFGASLSFYFLCSEKKCCR